MTSDSSLLQYMIPDKISDQKRVSAKAEFKKNRDGMGFMTEGNVRIITNITTNLITPC